MTDWSKYKVGNVAPTDETSQAIEPEVSKWDKYKVGIKKKEPLEVGSEDGGLSQTPAPGLQSGYQKIAESGQIPQNPFEQAALGQKPIDESVQPVQPKPRITTKEINPEFANQGMVEENWKALKSASLRAAGGVIGIPALVQSSLFEFVEKPIMKMTGTTDDEIDTQRIARKLTPIGTLPATINNEQTVQKLNSAASNIEATMKQYEGGIIESIDKGDFGSAVRQLTKGVVQSLPYLAGVAATSGGGTPAVLTTLGTAAASQRKGEIEEQGLMEGEYGKQLFNSWLYGGFEAGGELVTAGIFNNMRRALKGASQDVIKKTSNEIATEFLKEFGSESGSEMATELGQQLTDYFQGNRDNINLKEVGDAGIIGGFAVGPVSGTTSIANYIKGSRIASKEDIQKVQDNQAKIVDLKDKLNDTENPVIKETIQEEISQAEKENNDIAEKNAKLASELTPEQLSQVSNINRAIDENDAVIAEKQSKNEDIKIEEEVKEKLSDKKKEALKKKPKEKEAEEPIQTRESMEKYLLDEGYTPERAKEMLDMFGTFTEGYTYTPEEFSQAKAEGKVSIEEPSPVKEPIVEPKLTEEPTDASRIRENAGQVQEGGNVRQEGQGEGGPNLEQQEPEQPGDEKERLARVKKIPQKLTHVEGLGMGMNQAEGVYFSTEKKNRYAKEGKKAREVVVSVRNPIEFDQQKGDFHKVRTTLLNENKDKFTEGDFEEYQVPKKNKFSVDDLNDAGVEKLAKIVTDHFKKQGYDSIHFTGEGEGELVVFDKKAWKYKEDVDRDIHNAIVSRVKDYNDLPSTHKTKKSSALKDINNLVSKAGYSILQKGQGKIQVLKDGKPIKKITKQRTKEELQSHKALKDYENKEFVDFVEKLSESGSIVGLYDTGINSRDIPKAIKEIQSGVKSAKSNDLLDYLEQAFEKGEVSIWDADTQVRIPIAIKDILDSISEKDVSDEYVGQVEEVGEVDEIEQFVMDYVDGKITDEELKEYKAKWFTGFPYTEAEFNELANKYRHENNAREKERAEEDEAVDKGGEVGEPVQQESKAARETREKLDQEILDYEGLLKEAKVRKNKKIAEFNSRKGLFGDVKEETEAPKLFATETDFSQNSLNKFIEPEVNEIERLQSIIDRLKANKEQKINEAAGQQEFEETAFAKQKKGAKKPPLSKDKTIKVSEPIKGEKETIPPPEGPWIDEEKMSNEGLKGMEPPEIVELYKKLSGKFPGLKNFTDKLGVFYHKEGGEFKIMLNKSLFKGKDVEMLGKVIAHEVGHFIDSLPGITLKRGDILGRIASLKDYFSKLLAEKPGKEDTVLTDKDRVELRSEAKRSLKEEYDKGIREIIEEVIEETPVFDEVGLTAEDIRQIWIDNEAREKNPELYEYIAKLSGYQKAKIMKDAIKGLVDSEIVKRFNKGKIIGTKITKKQIKKIITPAPVTPQAIAEKYRELLKKEINKRRLFEAEIITEELKALTKWWNPFDVNQDATYTKYRHSSVELYAEAISVLFNNPQALAERAPFFNRAFFNYFGNKPTVKDVYNEIQGLLNKPKEDLFRDRLRRMFDGFKRSMKKRSEIANKKRESKLSWLDTVQKDLFSLIIPMIKPIPEGKHLTTALNDRQFLRNALEKMAFANERVAKMLVEMNNNVTTELEKSGISFEDFSAILAFDRQLSQRTTIANPYAFQQKASSELKAFIEANMSEKQVADMKRILDTFHKSVFDITEEAYKAGVYSKDMFDVIEKNKDSYVTYAVVDYIDKNSIPVSFKKATGTLKEIESPYISTLFKLASMIKATERQNAVNALIETYNKYLPGEITEAKSVKIKGVTIAEKVEQGKQTVHYWKNGKWTAIAVDPYIAEFFDLNRMAELNSVARSFRAYNKVFKPIVTTWNVGWAFFSNILRDHPRSFYNLFAILGSTENISKADLAVLPFTYLNTVRKILPQAKKFVDGDLTPLVDTMIDEGVLKHGFFGSYDPYADEPVGPIFQKFGLIQKDKSMRDKMAERSKILKYAIKILSGIEYLGQILEVSSKMTAFTILENKLKDAKSAGFYTRNYAGTPNYLDKGTLTHTTNEIFTFSNVILQALRTDSEIAFKPQTRGAYWTAQAISVVTPAALMALAAAGLFGDELEDLYAQLTEYEKTNYLCIVWGKTKDGKPIYSKIPIPEFSRISHAITYKIISNTTEKDGLEWRDATDILSVGAAMTPSPSPLIKTAVGWGQYLAQKNPYDAFYGETILTDREQAMRGWPALSKMATWSLKNMGGTFIVKMYDYDPLKNTTTEYTLQNIPLVSRMIKIGGRGQSETLSKVGEMERRKRAKESYERDKVVNDYVLKSVSLGLDYNKSGDVLDELKVALYGDAELTSEQKSEFAAAKKKFKAKLLKGLHTPFSNAVGAIIDSQSNDEKVVKLQQYGLIYGEDKLGELLRYMNEQDLISKPLKSKILQTVDGMDLDEEKRNLIIQSLNESGYYLDTFEGGEIPQE